MAAKKKARRAAASGAATASASGRVVPGRQPSSTADRSGTGRARGRGGPSSPGARRDLKLQLRSVGPTLTVDDIEKSLSWYRDVMGFAVGEHWVNEGKLAGVELIAGDAHFWLTQDDWQKGRDRVKGEGFRLHCETTQDVDRLADGIRTRGGSLLTEPHDEPWGGRAFAVADPDGFKMTIARAGE